MSNLEKCHDCGILTEEIYFNKHYGFVVCRKCAEYREIIEYENCIDKDQRIAELKKENERLKLVEKLYQESSIGHIYEEFNRLQEENDKFKKLHKELKGGSDE